MRLTKTQRVHAIVDQEIEYEVDDQQYQDLIDSGLTPEDALEEIRSQNESEVISIKNEVDEVTAVHESSVEES